MFSLCSDGGQLQCKFCDVFTSTLTSLSQLFAATTPSLCTQFTSLHSETLHFHWSNIVLFLDEYFCDLMCVVCVSLLTGSRVSFL